MHLLDLELWELVTPGYHLSSFAMPPRIAQECHSHKEGSISMKANRSKNVLRGVTNLRVRTMSTPHPQ